MSDQQFANEAADGQSELTAGLDAETVKLLHEIRHFAWRHGETNTVRKLDKILGGNPMELLRKKYALERT